MAFHPLRTLQPYSFPAAQALPSRPGASEQSHQQLGREHHHERTESHSAELAASKPARALSVLYRGANTPNRISYLAIGVNFTSAPLSLVALKPSLARLVTT